MKLYLNAISFAAPVAGDWESLRAGFSSEPGPASAEFRPTPACLSPRAARRLSPQIRLALTIAERIGPGLLADAGWVFASSIGEGETLKVMLDALCTPEMMIQPLRFQNAVHNAAVGQWSIAGGLTGPTTSLAAYDETVGAGLLKAAMQVTLERRAVGLVCYDTPLPSPLHEIHPLGMAIGAGLAFLPEATGATLATLYVEPGEGPPTPPRSEVGRALMDSRNPVAAIVPLLEMLEQGGEVMLGLHGGGALCVTVTPA